MFQPQSYLPGIEYLRRRILDRQFEPESPVEFSLVHEREDSDVLLDAEHEDDACASESCSRRTTEVCKVHLSICWSDSYQTPVLWFEAYRTSGAPLTLREIASSTIFHRSVLGPTYPLTTLDPNAASQPHLDVPDDCPATTPFISQSDHPATGRPSWFLHPCETSTIVDEVLSASPERHERLGLDAWAQSWVASWYMVVGSVVDLTN
ncbi:ATG3/ATG10 family protein [Sporobolomyces koalae]|uniref:ATG3/ATG10 family protein n=1 Tax=Sporobolomyces koalae TaxID=500713 RepID=UPI0031708B46